MRLRFSLLAVFFLLLPVLSPPALADEIPATPPRYVVDLAGIVEDGAEMKLDGYLKELEQKTTAQVVVLTVKSLEGIPIEDFSLRVAERWQLGQKDKDNGLLFTVAMKEHSYRFETGYGLEGILPDSRLGTIGRRFIVPAFRKGDYTGGIAGAVLAVAQAIADDAGVQITGMPRLPAGGGAYGRQHSPEGGLLGTLFLLALALGAGYMFIRHPRLFLLMLLFSGMGGSRRGWGGSGGFGGGGGFGGFGGGGGGGFGGGGASGGW
jgi:uncharacterized protein